MFGGGGGLNPRKMQQMMKQMGIEVDELDAESVVITLADGEQLVFDDADVTRMDARGQSTYQIVGDPSTRDADASSDDGTEVDASSGDETTDDVAAIPNSDVQIVAERAGVDPDAAREALEAADGDLAAAIQRLS